MSMRDALDEIRKHRAALDALDDTIADLITMLETELRAHVGFRIATPFGDGHLAYGKLAGTWRLLLEPAGTAGKAGCTPLQSAARGTRTEVFTSGAAAALVRDGVGQLARALEDRRNAINIAAELLKMFQETP